MNNEPKSMKIKEAGSNGWELYGSFCEFNDYEHYDSLKELVEKMNSFISEIKEKNYEIKDISLHIGDKKELSNPEEGYIFAIKVDAFNKNYKEK